MPLSPPAPRTHIHTRTVTVMGYEREDGLFDIEAQMTDTKTYGFRNNWRGEITPLYRLGAVMGSSGTPNENIIIIAETERGDNVGIAVDEIVGQQQVVVKSLEGNYGTVHGASAATILGDGLVALILDVDSMLRLAATGERLPATELKLAG